MRNAMMLSRQNRKNLVVRLLVCFALITTTSFIFSFAADTSGDIKKLIKQAVKLTRSGKLIEAEDALRKAVALDENRTEAKVELAFVLSKQRRLGEAYEIVLPIARSNPKYGRAYSVLGATLLSGGRFPDARRIFYTAIRIDRKQHLAWAGYGMLDFYENKIFQSLDNLNEAVHYGPTEPDYLFALAQVSARAERYKEAAQAYQDFLAVSNDADEDRRARIRGLINFLNYLGQAGTLYTVGGREQTSVPFDLIGNRPIIKLQVNGNPEPLRFVLDTGSGISVISDATAKRLKIKPITRGGFARGIGGNGKFEIVYGLLKEIKIGEVSLKQVPVYLRKFHDQSQAVDGYIGLALISKFLTTIDYGSSTFALKRRGNDEQDFPEMPGEISLPLRLTSSGFLSGEISMQGVEEPLNFIVDTGASVSVISDDVANTDLISPLIRSERLTVTGSAGITEDVKSYTLPRISFGNHSRKDIMAIALDLDLINEASGFEQSGILGGNFLKNYRMTFDFRNSKVIFESVRPEN